MPATRGEALPVEKAVEEGRGMGIGFWLKQAPTGACFRTAQARGSIPGPTPF